MLTIKPILKRASQKRLTIKIIYPISDIFYVAYDIIIIRLFCPNVKLKCEKYSILADFLAQTAYFGKIMHIFHKIGGFLLIAADEALGFYLPLSLRL